MKIIVDAQAVPKVGAAQGGWRYAPTSEDSDLSATAWAIRALYAARAAGVDVPDKVFSDAIAYALRLQNPDGGFAYVSGAGGHNSNLPRTAMALYALQKAGGGGSPQAARALEYLRAEYRKPQKSYRYYGILWSASALAGRGGQDAHDYAAWMVEHCAAHQQNCRWHSSFGDVLGTIFIALAYAPPG